MRRVTVPSVLQTLGLLVWTSGMGLAQDKPNTDLLAAAIHGDPAGIRACIDQGADPNTRDEIGNTALLLAIAHGHVDTVQALLDGKANVKLKSWYGQTPIVEAAEGGHLGILKLLLAAGASINDTGRDKRTPLLAAALKGHADMVRFLLDKKANIETRDLSGATALILASESGETEIVKLLLARKAKYVVDRFGRTAFMRALANGREETAKFLLSGPAKVTEQDSDHNTPFLIAIDGILTAKQNAFEKRKGILNLLLDKGADVNGADSSGLTSLMKTAELGNAEMIKYLISRKADPFRRDGGNRTALDMALMKGDAAVIAALREASKSIE